MYLVKTKGENETRTYGYGDMFSALECALRQQMKRGNKDAVVFDTVLKKTIQVHSKN